MDKSIPYSINIAYPRLKPWAIITIAGC